MVSSDVLEGMNDRHCVCMYTEQKLFNILSVAVIVEIFKGMLNYTLKNCLSTPIWGQYEQLQKYCFIPL